MPATRLGVCAGPSAVEASDSLYSSIPIHLSTHAQSEKEGGAYLEASPSLLSSRLGACLRVDRNAGDEGDATSTAGAFLAGVRDDVADEGGLSKRR